MRELERVIPAQPAQDGAGVKINRLAGPMLLPYMNPFLMIDEINSSNADDYLAGFPEHPHRGFETITYMKVGKMQHQDHMGNKETIGSGDVQWMTAGRGVLHSEMPQQESGLMHGFQIWLNLPAAEKMKPAQYQELLKDDIGECELSGGGTAKVMAGNLTVNGEGVSGPTQGLSTNPVIGDIKLSAGKSMELEVDPSNHALVFVYGGSATEIGNHQMGVFAPGDILKITADDEGAEFLVLSGNPIDEPVVQYGPFVMNSQEEIVQAMRDFQSREFLQSLAS